MNFGISDIKTIIEFFDYLKEKFFSGPNWQNESLQQDILKYFKDFYQELKSVDKKELDDTSKEILGSSYDELKRIDSLLSEDFEPKAFSKTQLEKSFNNYMKNGIYKKIFQDTKIKLYSYGLAIKECVKNYGNNDSKKLHKERQLFDNFVKDNLVELEKGYIDFMLTRLFPDRFDINSRNLIVNQTINKLHFEKYIPIVQKFLDKIDDRIV